MIQINDETLTPQNMAEKETGLRIPEQAQLPPQGLRDSRMNRKLHALVLVGVIAASSAGALLKAESTQAAEQSTASMVLENEDQLFDAFLVTYGRKNGLPEDVSQWSQDDFDLADLEFQDWVMSRITDEIIAKAERERLGAR